MFINHKDLLWMLSKVNGQRIDKDKLLRLFTSHGLSSFLPYYNNIEALYDRSRDKSAVINKLILALEARINHQLGLPHACFSTLSLQELELKLLPQLIQALKRENSSTLVKGARVTVRQDSQVSCVQPGCEGFITEQSSGTSTIRFYSSPGRYNTDIFSLNVPDSELQLLNLSMLTGRHDNLEGIAHYYLNDSLMSAMRSRIDSSIYADAANLALSFLAIEGFVEIKGDDYIGAPEHIFSALAPQLDATYKNPSLFSSHSLSSPPSERKPHVLRLELTTGCDYNKCNFCSEYSGMTPVTKSIGQFKEHTDQVVASIGSEKSKIKRLFIGSGNSLGVETDLLLEALNYASTLFAPKRISLYGRTASILEKSLDELKKLKEAGLSLIYWGLESGSDEVLSYIHKDCTRNHMIGAAKMLAEAEIETSAMLMPGAGGLRFSEQHVSDTLELLHNIDIDYLTLLSINPAADSDYTRKMAAEPDNRPLTTDEVNAQIYKLLEGLNYPDLKINMFTEEVDQVSCNTRRFNYKLTASNKELLLREFTN
jgi:Radical SAM superfamily